MSASSFEVAANPVERGAARRDQGATLERGGVVEVAQSACPRSQPRGSCGRCATAIHHGDDEIEASRPLLEGCATSELRAATSDPRSSLHA